MGGWRGVRITCLLSLNDSKGTFEVVNLQKVIKHSTNNKSKVDKFFNSTNKLTHFQKITTNQYQINKRSTNKSTHSNQQTLYQQQTGQQQTHFQKNNTNTHIFFDWKVVLRHVHEFFATHCTCEKRINPSLDRFQRLLRILFLV